MKAKFAAIWAAVKLALKLHVGVYLLKLFALFGTKPVIVAMLALAGMALVTLGIAMYSLPVSLIFGGVLLVLIAFDAAR